MADTWAVKILFWEFTYRSISPKSTFFITNRTSFFSQSSFGCWLHAPFFMFILGLLLLTSREKSCFDGSSVDFSNSRKGKLLDLFWGETIKTFCQSDLQGGKPKWVVMTKVADKLGNFLISFSCLKFPERYAEICWNGLKWAEMGWEMLRRHEVS